MFVEDNNLEKVISCTNLGVIINESLSWGDHVEYIHRKISKRPDVLKRIKHLLPLHTRKLVASCLILPIFDYADLVYGDRNNVTTMNNLQVIT